MRQRDIGIGLAVVGAAFVLGTGGRRAGSRPSVPGPTPSPSPTPTPHLPPAQEGDQAELRYLLEAAGLDNSWVIFFEATAAGESGFNPIVGRGNSNGDVPNYVTIYDDNREVAGAERSYDRNDYLADCPYAESRYIFGSGGDFAQLPGNAVHAFKGTQLECIDPWEVFNRRTSLVMAIEMARRLTGWSAFKADPTWLTLRTGWGSPTEMDDPDAIDRMAWAHNKFADRLEQIGVDPDFMFEPVTALPARDPVGLLQHLNVL